LVAALVGGVAVVAIGVGVAVYLNAGGGGSTSESDTPPQVAGAGDPEPDDEPSAIPAAAKQQCPDGMVALSGGSFFMGTDADSAVLASARPQFKVDVKPFCLDRHEVTVTEYRECSRQGECRRAFRDSDWPRGAMDAETWNEHKKIFSELCNERATGRGDHPVNCLDYEQAETYCKHLGKRLPTEAEWEFAARGSDGRIYPWGDNPPTETLANACGIECKNWRESQGLPDSGVMFETDDGYVGTAPVERFGDGATESGLFDMVGNVFEWTSSDFLPYTKTGYGEPESDAQPRKVIRGGAFNSGHADFARPSMRAAMDPQAHTHGIGMRCAAEPTKP
jgi:formylglycine-generating enzyme required for sulfatase activity